MQYRGDGVSGMNSGTGNGTAFTTKVGLPGMIRDKTVVAPPVRVQSRRVAITRSPDVSPMERLRDEQLPFPNLEPVFQLMRRVEQKNPYVVSDVNAAAAGIAAIVFALLPDAITGVTLTQRPVAVITFAAVGCLSLSMRMIDKDSYKT